MFEWKLKRPAGGTNRELKAGITFMKNNSIYVNYQFLREHPDLFRMACSYRVGFGDGKAKIQFSREKIDHWYKINESNYSRAMSKNAGFCIQAGSLRELNLRGRFFLGERIRLFGNIVEIDLEQ